MVFFVCLLCVPVGWCVGVWVCMGCVWLCNNALSFFYSSCQYHLYSWYALIYSYVRLYFDSLFITLPVSAAAIWNARLMQFKYIYKFIDRCGSCVFVLFLVPLKWVPSIVVFILANSLNSELNSKDTRTFKARLAEAVPDYSPSRIVYIWLLRIFWL